MSDINRQILSELEAENIDVSALGVEVKKGKGFLKRGRKILEIFGSVANKHDKDAVMRVAARHAGDNYDVTDNLVTKK